MFEHHKQPLLPKTDFIRRLWRFAGLSLLLISCSWLIGIFGYKLFEHMSWIDAILNSAMILGGMGPVDPLHSDAAKIFASFYALFSGVIFLVVVGIILAPMAHRILHYLHLEDDESMIREKRLDELVSKE